jgi:hypothetical protein
MGDWMGGGEVMDLRMDVSHRLCCTEAWPKYSLCFSRGIQRWPGWRKRGGRGWRFCEVHLETQKMAFELRFDHRSSITECFLAFGMVDEYGFVSINLDVLGGSKELGLCTMWMGSCLYERHRLDAE